MNKLLSLALLCFLLNCNSDKKTKSATISKENLHLVNFLGTKVYLPDGFKKTSFEAFSELMKNASDLDNLSNYQLQRLNNLTNMDDGHELFVFGDNYFNTITFQESDYFEFDRTAVSVYVEQLENVHFNEPRSRGIEFERLESKYLTYGISKIIKVKYLQKFQKKRNYLTQYIINYKLHTFGITIANSNGDDHQVILSNFKQ